MASIDRSAIPNLITIGRILAIPLVALLLVPGNFWLRLLALILYVVAAATDWLDGYLARKWNAGSNLGRMLDPIADKLLVAVLIIVLAWDGSLSGWDLIPATAIMMREILVSGLREYLGPSGIVVKVSQLAKWKTTIQLVALAIIIFEGLVPGIGLVSDIVWWVAGLLTVWTGIEYFRGAWPHLVGGDK